MKYAERIEHLYELRGQKEKLQKELDAINHDIDEAKKNCNHIGINLGYKDWMSNTGKMNICLICARPGNYFDPRYLVHAEEYLEEFDPSIEEEYQEKFGIIQMMALGIMKKYPEIGREEIVVLLNHYIQSHIAKRKEKTKTHH